MRHSENDHDKNFVMSDGYENADTLDEYRNETYKVRDTSLRKSTGISSILAGAGFVIFVILSIIILFKTQNLAKKAQLLTLESKLGQLEQRLANLETIDKNSGPSKESENQLELLTERINRLESGVDSNFNQILNELNRLKLETALQKSIKTEAPQPPKKEEKLTTPKAYKVQAGDTLYGISRRYGLTLEQLRTYNKLGPAAKIYPGQELKLAPPETN